jgi:DNA-directed RNA polymerase subunit M/transcription elongation factor TFIIS
MARCFACGSFLTKPTQSARQIKCASCGASYKVPASKARRVEVARNAAHARVASQTPEERSLAAGNAARARWAKAKEN